MFDLKNISKKNQKVLFLLIVCLVIGTIVLICYFNFKQPGNYHSYIRQNEKSLEKLFGFKKMDDELYNKLVSNKMILRIDRDASSFWRDYKRKDWYYVEYRKEEVERYKEECIKHYPFTDVIGLNNAFYCEGGDFRQEVLGFETQDQANEVFSVYKDRLRSAYEFEYMGNFLGEVVPYIGILESESYTIYCWESRSADYITCEVVIKDDALNIVNFFQICAIKSDDMFKKFVTYLEKMGLPSLDEIDMVVEGTGRYQTEE